MKVLLLLVCLVLLKAEDAFNVKMKNLFPLPEDSPTFVLNLF